MEKLRDKNDRVIEPGAVLKVFHFVGLRRRRHYMYKQAVEYMTLMTGPTYLKISHLNRVADEPWKIGDNYYLERADGRMLTDYEIVQ